MARRSMMPLGQVFTSANLKGVFRPLRHRLVRDDFPEAERKVPHVYGEVGVPRIQAWTASRPVFPSPLLKRCWDCFETSCVTSVLYTNLPKTQRKRQMATPVIT